MKTAVVIQARFDSTRLPGKALKTLGGVPMLAWTMRALHAVPADFYVLATDDASCPRFAPIAASCGYQCIKGPKNDVLKRFCMVIQQTGADIILRATGDNPYLFYEAASWTLEHFDEYHSDYLTLTNLPHGSGVEVFSAAALLDAAARTDDSYDHEHVGPALYRHSDLFQCSFVPADDEYRFPSLRTTVDTPEDYDVACRRVSFLSAHCADTITSFMMLPPPCVVDICSAAQPVLIIPCIKNKRGTGHVRRCCTLLKSVPHSFLYVPHDSVYAGMSDAVKRLLSNVPPGRILSTLPPAQSCALVVTDGFRISAHRMSRCRNCGPVVAIDEGGTGRRCADFLLDIIPNIQRRPPNMCCPEFMELPSVRRSSAPVLNDAAALSILVSFGGEDPARLSHAAAYALAELYPHASITVTGYEPACDGSICFCRAIPDLKTALPQFDLVVTHYGFTAFESRAAGCSVILVAPTPYHGRLSAAYGFACIPSTLVKSSRKKAVQSFAQMIPYAQNTAAVQMEQKDLPQFIGRCAATAAHSHHCPVCGSLHSSIVSRVSNGTFRRCSVCSIIYRQSFSADVSAYDVSYFFDQYAAQYGKTYLEDFESIKKQGIRRCSHIMKLCTPVGGNQPAVLDIGCAFGPFLAAAQECGMRPFGMDIPPEAIDYVCRTLHITAVEGSFPQAADKAAEMISGGVYDVITMWWVIEHFSNVETVLAAVNRLLKKGGVFAFSTPSAVGVSGTYSPDSFYAASPVDHCTVWSPATAKKVLRRFGFKVVTIISTGHHPERFPGYSQNGINQKKLSIPKQTEYDKLLQLSQRKKRGDSFEVYAVKHHQYNAKK